MSIHGLSIGVSLGLRWPDMVLLSEVSDGGSNYCNATQALAQPNPFMDIHISYATLASSHGILSMRGSLSEA